MPEKKGLDIEALKEIIKIMKESNVSEISIEQGGIKIHVKQEYVQPVHAVGGVLVPTVHEKVEHPSRSEALIENTVFISAPMVGTFYRAPSSDADPYVEVKGEVKAGQVICIIEAMKYMNEIIADMDCEIIEILVEDGQSVEYEQPIFRVRTKA